MDFGRANGGKAKWVAMGRDWAGFVATSNFGLPIYFRMWMLAMSRIDRHGHAAFVTGELSELLATVDKGTGEVRPASASGVDKALAKLKADRLVHADSTPRCIRLPRTAVQFPRGAVVYCQPHK